MNVKVDVGHKSAEQSQWAIKQFTEYGVVNDAQSQGSALYSRDAQK